MTAPTSITVYSREQCHLCDEAMAVVRRVVDELDAPVDVRHVDVDDDPELQAAYGDRVPYVLVNDTPRFKYRVDEDELRQLLDEDVTTAVEGQ